MLDRVTSTDSSSSDFICLTFVCCRPALLLSVVFVRAWSVYPVVVRQRLVRQLVRLSRCRCGDRRPSQSLSLWRPSSVSAAVAIETVVRPARPSSRTPSAEVAVDCLTLRGRRTSSSSSSSSSTLERRHPVARRPRRSDNLRHRPLRRSFVVPCVRTHSTCRVRTLVFSRSSSVNCVLTNLRKVL